MKQAEEKQISTDDSVKKLKIFLKDYYVSILTAVMIVFSFLLVFLPQFNDIFTLQNQVKKQNSDFELYSKKLALLSSLSDADLNSKVSLVEIALPSEKPAFSTLEILQVISKKFEMQVTNFEFSPGLLATESAALKNRSNSAKGAPDLDSIFVDVSMEGEYENLLTFVDYLENSLPVVDVSSISFSSELDGGGVSATLSMIVYYSPAPETIGKVSDPIKTLSSAQLEIYESIRSYPKIITQQIPFSSEDARINPFDY